MRRPFRQFLATFTFGIANKLIGVFTTIILARLLMPEGYGLYAIAFSVVFLVNNFADIGIFNAVSKYAAETENDADIVWTGFVIDGAVTASVFILLLILAGPLADWMNKPVANLIIICSLYLVPCFFDIFSARLLARRRIELLSTVSLTYTVLSGILSIGLVLLHYGVVGAIVGYIIARSFLTLMILKFGWIKGRIHWNLGKKLLRFGLFSYVSMLSITFIGYFDRITLGFFVPSEAVGFYAVAQGFADLIVYIPTAFTTVAFPIISRAQAENDDEKIKKIYEAGVYGCGIYAILITIASLVLAWPIIRWVFGLRYLSAIPIFQVCIFASAAGCLFTVFSIVLVAMDRPDLGAKINVVLAAIAIAGFPVFVWTIGVIGAAIVDVILQSTGLILGYIATRRITGVKIKFNFEAVSSFFKLLMKQIGFS